MARLFCPTILITLLTTLRNVFGRSLLKSIEVPNFTFSTSTATLSCVYDLGNSRLYSLKWYHNNTEFYRYVPTERLKPVNIGPTNMFMLREVSRDDTHVTLSLGKLTPSASGTYKCEVMAEHPSFRTEMKEAFMRVLGEKLSPPLIKGVREVYETSDLITVGCEPTNALYAEPRPKINWLMDGRELPKRYLSQYGHTLDGRYKGISLHIPGQLVLEAGGSVQVECRLKLGPFEERSTRTLRAKMEHKSLASAPSEDGNGEQSKSGSSWNIPTAHLIFTYSLYIPLQPFRNVLR